MRNVSQMTPHASMYQLDARFWRSRHFSMAVICKTQEKWWKSPCACVTSARWRHMHHCIN